MNNEMMEPIIKAYMTELNAQMEKDILKVCHSYGIDVNKERLTQALTDARKFYDEGYRAGKLDAGPKWISVEDRLPETESRCLVVRYDGVTKTSFIDILWFDKETWWNRIFGGEYAVTHWMPLPEPPKEEKP